MVSTLNPYLLRIDKVPIGNINNSENPITDNTIVNTINIEKTNKTKHKQKHELKTEEYSRYKNRYQKQIIEESQQFMSN